jgi:transcriptional regulator with XRE-family HTH domain
MRAKGFNDTRLAEAARVSVKTINRWLSGESLPQAVNARAIADVLGVEPSDLWPDIFPVLDPPSTGTVPVSVYAGRAHVPMDVWRERFAQVREQIDVCVYGGTFLFDAVPGFLYLVEDALEQGVRARFAVGDPDSQIVYRRGEEEGIGSSLPERCRLTLARLKQLPVTPGLEIRTHRTTLYASIFRTDDELIANHHIYGAPASDNPCLLIREDDNPELWKSYRRSFERIWNTATPA